MNRSYRRHRHRRPLTSSSRAELLESRRLLASTVYWVPFVESNGTGASDTENYVEIDATVNSTTVQLDLNHDGTSEITKVLNAKESIVIGGVHNGAPADYSGLVAGTRIVTSAPVNATYSFHAGDYGAYEDGAFEYSVPTAAQAG